MSHAATLWRSVKYEEVYLCEYADGWEAQERLRRYFEFYCDRRIHQSLGYRTPASVYQEKGAAGRPTDSSPEGGQTEKVDDVSRITSGDA